MSGLQYTVVRNQHNPVEDKSSTLYALHGSKVGAGASCDVYTPPPDNVSLHGVINAQVIHAAYVDWDCTKSFRRC
eukprot:COSAG01_NODE_5223_length_4402_cov_3.387869_3_plen_75_part_00